jgi:putative phosphoribosyl transferase
LSNPTPQDGLDVVIRHGGSSLDGELTVPVEARATIILVPGSGASRRTPRNVLVAAEFNAAGFATLSFDVLTPAEAADDARTARYRFAVDLVAARVQAAIDFVRDHQQTKGMPVGLYGVGSGAAAALSAAAERPGAVGAVVSRAGRTELAWSSLGRVTAPTLLIAGEHDQRVAMLNGMAARAIAGEARLELVKGAGHLFEEVGAIAAVAALAVEWFQKHLAPVPAGSGAGEAAR